MRTKAKKGTTICTLDDLTFPVELIDNPNRTNREYSKVVRGVVDETVPYFSNEDMEIMKDSLSEEELKIMIDENPKTKVVKSPIDLNYCSPIYELVPNEMIFPKVEEIFRQHGIAFSVEYSHTHHARFYGNYIIEDPRFAYKMAGTNDVIKFIWNFQHSYNGLTKYKGICGFYRLVCTNGLTVPVQEMKEYNLVIEGKHTSSIMKSLEQFSDILTKLTVNLMPVKTAITAKYEILGGRMVTNVQDRVKEVLNVMKIVNEVKEKDTTKMSTKELGMYSKLIETNNEKVKSIIDNITAEANDAQLGYNGRINDWLIYNGINQYLYDDDRNIAAPEKRRETDSSVLEYMLENA